MGGPAQLTPGASGVLSSGIFSVSNFSFYLLKNSKIARFRLNIHALVLTKTKSKKALLSSVKKRELKKVVVVVVEVVLLVLSVRKVVVTRQS